MIDDLKKTPIKFSECYALDELVHREVFHPVTHEAGLSSDCTCKEGRISSIERSGSWYYLYDENGKKYKTLSVSSVGDIVGYSSTFFVSTSSSWIYLWDTEGKKYKTLSASSIGQIIGITGDTFTSRNGSWIYTWDRDGKKINTRAAR